MVEIGMVKKGACLKPAIEQTEARSGKCERYGHWFRILYHHSKADRTPEVVKDEKTEHDFVCISIVVVC